MAGGAECLSFQQFPDAADSSKDYTADTLRNSWPGPGSYGLLIIQSRNFVASIKTAYFRGMNE